MMCFLKIAQRCILENVANINNEWYVIGKFVYE